MPHTGTALNLRRDTKSKNAAWLLTHSAVSSSDSHSELTADMIVRAGGTLLVAHYQSARRPF